MLKNLDKIAYKVKVIANGGGENIKEDGVVVLEVNATSNKITYNVLKNTLSSNASSVAIVERQVTELFLYIAGFGGLQNIEAINTIGRGKCPIIIENQTDKTVKGEIPASQSSISIPIKYKCRYSNGVLVYSNVDIHGNYNGKEVAIQLEASLLKTTIQGVRPYAHKGISTNIILLSAIVIILTIILVIMLLLRKR